MLSEDLQVEIKNLLAYINSDWQELIERANRPNFECIYDDELVHPEIETIRMFSVLHYHADEGIAKLTTSCHKNMGIWEIETVPVFPNSVFEADSSSDAIRMAQKEIKSREAQFLEYYAADALTPQPPLPHGEEELDNPTPDPSPKHQGGE